MPENLTRREFLRAVGIAGAGVTLATTSAGAAIDPGDDSKSIAVPHRFWWVRAVDKPTTEIDWKAMKRYNEWGTTRGSLRQYRGAEKDDYYLKLQKDNLAKWEKEGKPGYTTKDIALEAAVGTARAPFQFRGPQKVNTPKDRGVTRYEGSPEENARIVTVALRHLGAASVGFIGLDEDTTLKLIYNQEPAPGKRSILFENVEEGYEEKDRLVIPKRARWAIVYSVQMSGETLKRAPTKTSGITVNLGYTRLWNILAQAHEFFRALGWQSYGPTEFNGLGIYPALAVMAGLGEMGRHNRLITPEYGPTVRLGALITDLPLAPTQPIDFGVMRFCQDCKTCADLCPSKSISSDREPTWEVQGPWNNSGHKAWFENSVTCRNYWNEVGTGCSICFAACPFAQEDRATIHQILKATVATTPVFNSLIKTSTDLYYPAEVSVDKPLKDPESWWANTNFPEHAINTMQGGRKL